MLPMAYVTTWNLSDEKRKAAYEDIPEWEKENNLIFIPPNPTKDESGKWNVIKIPYSQEIAQLTRPVRRIQEQIAGLDPVRFGEVADALFQTGTSLNVSSPEGFVSTVAPQALKPTMETFTNKKFYTGGPVVPDNLNNLAPEAQFYTNETKSGQKRVPTSGTIKALASKIGLSPIKTEFWLNETFGGLTSNIVNNVDTIASKLGAIKPEEVGGVGFLDSIKSSYNKAYGNEGVSKKYQALDDKLKELSKLSDPEDRTVALQDYISSLPEEERRGALNYMRNLGTKGISISEDIIRMKPTYTKVQDLVSQGNNAEAQKVVDSLSEEDYKAYKKVRASVTSASTKVAKVAFKPTFDKIQEMIAQGKKAEAQKIVDKLSDDEYHIYKLLKESS
jgi:regulator of sigma D